MATQISFALAYWERRIEVCEARVRANPTSPEPLRAYGNELYDFVSHLRSVRSYSRADLAVLTEMCKAIREARATLASWGQPAPGARRRRRPRKA